MRNEDYDFEKDTSIDPTALDVEWLDQPGLMMRYTRLLAQAEREYEQAKTDLDVTRAELDKEIRMDPDSFDIVKITEEVVKNTINAHDDYQNDHRLMLEKLYEFKMMKGAVQAIEHKKTALENLVKLNGQQYFAGPHVPRDLSKEWESSARQKESDREVKKSMTRRRTK